MKKSTIVFLLQIFIGAPILLSAMMGLALLMYHALLFIGMHELAAFMVMIASGVLWACAIFFVIESK